MFEGYQLLEKRLPDCGKTGRQECTRGREKVLLFDFNFQGGVGLLDAVDIEGNFIKSQEIFPTF